VTGPRDLALDGEIGGDNRFFHILTLRSLHGPPGGLWANGCHIRPFLLA
jgi:hypothetical protein